jgi:uncharacterized protein (TIGR03435 family)
VTRVLRGIVALALLVVSAAALHAQDLTGVWQGTLKTPNRDIRLVVKIAKDIPTGYKAIAYSIDQGGSGLPSTSFTTQLPAVKFAFGGVGAAYDGKLTPDNSEMDGTFTQGGQPLPLILKHVTAETAWAIPAPPPRLEPMDPKSNPSFEVATVKPANPDEKGMGFRVNGRRFSTINTTLTEILQFAYGVQGKQVVGGPAWMEADKWDIDAKPEGTGQPSDAQWKSMLQKLVAERFQLKFHHDKKELAVYALQVGKTGPKLTKSEGNAAGLPGLFFTGAGVLNVTNATMLDFADLMQEAVLDRPVLDQTGLKDRYDFQLKWTPDESQFGGRFRSLPPLDNPAPGLYTAIQEQIGLRLEPTRAPADVLVIDHVEKPTAN